MFFRVSLARVYPTLSHKQQGDNVFKCDLNMDGTRGEVGTVERCHIYQSDSYPTL